MVEETNKPTNVAYFDKRMVEMRLNENDLKTFVYRTKVIDAEKQKYETIEEPEEFFKVHERGIEIIFKNLEGKRLELKANTTWPKPISRVRYSPEYAEYVKAVKGTDQKYQQDIGTGSLIYHTESIINHYINEKECNTLYLVEGEFKAFTAWKYSTLMNDNTTFKSDSIQEKIINFNPSDTYGLPIMAITGIWNFKDEDKKNIHDDIRRFILRCKVKHVVVIYDSDFNSISNKFGEDEDENLKIDLAKRNNQFYQAALTIKTMLMNMVQDVVLMANTNIEHKGLDDLLTATNPTEPIAAKILAEMYLAPQTTSKFEYFNVINLTSEKIRAIRDFFAVDLKYFFSLHCERLWGKYFMFNRNTYYANASSGDFELKKHGDSAYYARVGVKYWKILDKPDIYGNILKELVEWSKTAINEDFISKGHKNFLDTIPKYDAFINMPLNDSKEYKREVEQGAFKYFNLYEPISHEPQKGEWKSIKMYLDHIFADQIHYALDYIKLMYEKPQEKLPMICLVSAQSHTGKSAFLRLIQNIFQNNAVIIGNQEITDSFNDDYASKLAIGIDEGLIEKDETTEKIKNWVTNPTIQMNRKNVARAKMPFFAKLFLTSNHENNFMRISQTEDRLWVRQIPNIKVKDHYLEDKMKEEIPAFLFYLINEHKLLHEQRKGRLWFDPIELETQALINLKKRSGSSFERNFKLIMKETFKDINLNPRQAHYFDFMYYTINEILDLSKDFKSYDKSYIHSELTRLDYTRSSSVTTFIVPEKNNYDGTDDYIFTPIKIKKREPYCFHISEFLEDHEIAKLRVKNENDLIENKDLF